MNMETMSEFFEDGTLEVEGIGEPTASGADYEWGNDPNAHHGRRQRVQFPECLTEQESVDRAAAMLSNAVDRPLTSKALMQQLASWMGPRKRKPEEARRLMLAMERAQHIRVARGRVEYLSTQ